MNIRSNPDTPFPPSPPARCPHRARSSLTPEAAPDLRVPLREII